MQVSLILARISSPLVWCWPGHTARKLHDFARTEQSSVLDLNAAARGTPSAERAALYLAHARDEERHARLFAERSADLRRARRAPPLPPPRADFERLYEVLGEAGFLALVHRGERRGRQQFEAYRDWFMSVGRADLAALFASIAVDERRHEQYSYRLLVEVAGDERRAKKKLARAARWEAWRSWRRAGRVLAGLTYTGAMLILYAVVLPLALLVKVLRPARAGWRPPGHPGAG